VGAIFEQNSSWGRLNKNDGRPLVYRFHDHWSTDSTNTGLLIPRSKTVRRL